MVCFPLSFPFLPFPCVHLFSFLNFSYKWDHMLFVFLGSHTFQIRTNYLDLNVQILQKKKSLISNNLLCSAELDPEHF